MSNQSSSSVVVPSKAVLEEILSKEIVFDDDNDKVACERMVNEDLTGEEVELAANTSYAYWAWTKLEGESDQFRNTMAIKEARRHYLGEDRDYELALEKLKACVAWRKREHIDLFRVCFHRNEAPAAGPNVATVVLSDDGNSRCEHLELLLVRDLEIQKMAVRGIDKEGRAIIVKLSRTEPWVGEDDDDDEEEEGYLFTQYYMAERAMAVSEIQSTGTVEHVTLVADYSDYESVNSPPFNVISKLVSTLQPVYPERLGKALILGAPLWMQTVLTLIRPFLATKTSEKFVLTGSMSNLFSSSSWSLLMGTSTSNADQDVIEEVVDPSQAMPFMLASGSLTDPLDTERQLKNVPFFEPYDTPCQSESSRKK